MARYKVVGTTGSAECRTAWLWQKVEDNTAPYILEYRVSANKIMYVGLQYLPSCTGYSGRKEVELPELPPGDAETVEATILQGEAQDESRNTPETHN